MIAAVNRVPAGWGEDEMSVLPRHTKVVVTGNNRTKSVLVGLHGVVKKAVGLGGWHWLVIRCSHLAIAGSFLSQILLCCNANCFPSCQFRVLLAPELRSGPVWRIYPQFSSDC
jgi:hypothetical protein